jgi:hypothetical protein
MVEVPDLNCRPLNRRIIEKDSLKQVCFYYINHMINGCAGFDPAAAMAGRTRPPIDPFVQADTI